jgi:hypothetical protein
MILSEEVWALLLPEWIAAQFEGTLILRLPHRVIPCGEAVRLVRLGGVDRNGTVEAVFASENLVLRKAAGA